MESKLYAILVASSDEGLQEPIFLRQDIVSAGVSVYASPEDISTKDITEAYTSEFPYAAQQINHILRQEGIFSCVVEIPAKTNSINGEPMYLYLKVWEEYLPE